MGLKNDLEYWVYKVTDYVEANLNANITAINTEKSSTDVSELGLASAITLETMNAYYWNMNIGQIPTEVPYVAYRWLSSPDGQAGPHTSEKIQIVVAVVVSDQWSTDSSLVNRRFMRYRKALKETLQGVERKCNLQGFKLTQIPDDVLFEGQNYWAIPVVVEFSFA